MEKKKKKCNINFIRLKRGGTVVNVRISAKGSTRRSMLRGYSEQEYYRAKERGKKKERWLCEKIHGQGKLGY